MSWFQKSVYPVRALHIIPFSMLVAERKFEQTKALEVALDFGLVDLLYNIWRVRDDKTTNHNVFAPEEVKVFRIFVVRYYGW